MLRLLMVIFFGVALFVAKHGFAHPIDYGEISVQVGQSEDGVVLEANTVRVDNYINIMQAALLVERERGERIMGFDEVKKWKDVYEPYAHAHVSVKNNGNECEPSLVEMRTGEDDSYLTVGARLISNYTCADKLDVLKIEDTMFVEEVENQVNLVRVFINGRLDKEETLDRNKTGLTLNVSDDSNHPINSSSPLTEKGIVGKLTQVLNQVLGQSVWLAMAVVFLLGLLHTLEAGHSKTVLISSMVNKKMDIKRGLGFAVVFTFTHLADIIVLGIIFVVADQFIDIYGQFSTLQQFSGYALVLLALYMLFRSTTDFIRLRQHNNYHKQGHDHNHDGEHDHGHVHAELIEGQSFKDQLALGFITGLAPCLFGWSIFVLILSTKNVWSLFPIILSFGLGIFTALVGIVFLVGKLKLKVFDRYSVLAEISPVVSAGILLIYAVWSIA